jgi:RHS repeat-associated protein
VSTGTVTTRFAYDGDNIWADLDGSSNVLVRYLYGSGPDQPLTRTVASGANAGVSAYLTDRLGSVRDLMNWSGQLQDHIDFDGYGNAVTESNPTVSDRFRYAGGQFDSNTGLDQFGARPYDPKTGRWLAEDPLSFGAGDTDLYRYVGNSPTNSTDPSGFGTEVEVPALVPTPPLKRNRPTVRSLAAAGYQSCVLCHGHPHLGWPDLAATPSLWPDAPLSQRLAIATTDFGAYNRRYRTSVGAISTMVVRDYPAVIGSLALTATGAGAGVGVPALLVSVDTTFTDFGTFVSGGDVGPTVTTRMLADTGLSDFDKKVLQDTLLLLGAGGLSLRGGAGPKLQEN